MQAHLLGSGTSVPSATRSAAGLFIHNGNRLEKTQQSSLGSSQEAMLEAGSTQLGSSSGATSDSQQSAPEKPFGLLVDASAGTSHRLAAAGFEPTDISEILITHFHPDHVCDLVPLLFALKNPRYKEKLIWPRIIGPRGILKLYQQLREPFKQWLPEAQNDIQIFECNEQEITSESYNISAIKVQHTSSSLAYRIADHQGVVICCSGDTEECEAIVEISRNVDLLFLECSFPSHLTIAGHLNSQSASRIIRASAAKRVVLTHLNPECDEVDLLSQIDLDVRRRVELGQDLGVYVAKHSAE